MHFAKTPSSSPLSYFSAILFVVPKHDPSQRGCYFLTHAPARLYFCPFFLISIDALPPTCCSYILSDVGDLREVLSPILLLLGVRSVFFLSFRPFKIPFPCSTVIVQSNTSLFFKIPIPSLLSLACSLHSSSFY